MKAIQRLTFEEYLALDDTGVEGRCELVDGELLDLPPESGLNVIIASYLFLMFREAGIPFQLLHAGRCEVQTPVLEPGDAANRFPDLVILRREHLPLVQHRLTVTIDMPPPRLVVEVVSPGKTSYDRDYIRKRHQYAVIGVPEYWIVNPDDGTVLVLEWQAGHYVEVGRFQGDQLIQSLEVPQLRLTAGQVFAVGELE
ncbi:MAG: Uma2 family endonuclease [Leptolyngbyaceae cyanobacterium bins.59]|nr:Uma2 family endonuclease [Leptolyngbyaceae cyanobacterium bins.59]